MLMIVAVTMYCPASCVFFFFQAEDGIRDRNVTGVQTCALPICGADIILIPEIPYSPDIIAQSIRERQREGSKFDIVVVAEGAKRVGGEERYLDKATRRLGGIAYQVAADIAQQIELEIRVTVLGHIQRGGSPIPFDRILATRFGKAAADLIARGDVGKMVALRGDDICAVPISH